MKSLLALSGFVLLGGAACYLLHSNANFARTDLFAYRAASILFFEGMNPYSVEELRYLQAQLGSNSSGVANVWNPPLIFLVYGAILVQPVGVLTFVWGALTSLAACGLLLTGWYLSGERGYRLTLPHAIAGITLVLSSYPFLAEISIFQISSITGLIALLALILLLRRAHFYSGVLLAGALIKPHAVFLPLIIAAVWVLRGRLVRVVLGGLVGIAIAAVTCQLINPNIMYNWISRAEWPVTYLGSSFPSIARSLLEGWGYRAPFLLAPGISALLCIFYLYCRWKKLARPEAHELIIALMVNPFVTPYSYVFDQVTILVVAAYLIGRSGAVCSEIRLRVFLSLVSIGPICAMISNVRIATIPISWLLYPLGTLLVYLSFKKSLRL